MKDTVQSEQLQPETTQHTSKVDRHEATFTGYCKHPFAASTPPTLQLVNYKSVGAFSSRHTYRHKSAIGSCAMVSPYIPPLSWEEGLLLAPLELQLVA